MNLWPDIFTDEYRNTPLENLLFQAETFDYRFTETHRVTAHCRYIKPDDVAILVITTTLPRENRSVEILEIHNANVYPCKVWFDDKMSKCKTQAELIGKLAWIFNHQKTVNYIKELIK